MASKNKKNLIRVHKLKKKSTDKSFLINTAIFHKNKNYLFRFHADFNDTLD